MQIGGLLFCRVEVEKWRDWVQIGGWFCRVEIGDCGCVWRGGEIGDE